VVWLISHSHLSPQGFPPWILLASGYKAVGLRLGRVQFDPVSKVFLTKVSRNRGSFVNEVFVFENASARGGVCTNVEETLT